jgi:hypothetical protein
LVYLDHEKYVQPCFAIFQASGSHRANVRFETYRLKTVQNQGCQILVVRDTKTGKMYRIGTKCTKWS